MTRLEIPKRYIGFSLKKFSPDSLFLKRSLTCRQMLNYLSTKKHKNAAVKVSLPAAFSWILSDDSSYQTHSMSLSFSFAAQKAMAFWVAAIFPLIADLQSI